MKPFAVVNEFKTGFNSACFHVVVGGDIYEAHETHGAASIRADALNKAHRARAMEELLEFRKLAASRAERQVDSLSGPDSMATAESICDDICSIDIDAFMDREDAQ